MKYGAEAAVILR